MKCDYCTEKCPQAETICELAKGRMYATNEVVKLQKQLEEYKTLEEQGLLLRLPCKVGDKVYALNKTKREIFPSRVEHIEYVVNDNLDFPLTKIKGEGFCVFFDDFGKIVFLTKEEAEQKLKEMERA